MESILHKEVFTDLHYFTRKNVPLEDVFKLIAKTNHGRKTLRRFLPKYAADEIKVQEVKAQEFNFFANPEPTGKPAACFVYAKGKRTIYYQQGEELGILALLLFHEILHSIDEDYISSLKTQELLWSNFVKKSQAILADTAKRLFIFINELKETIPEYLRYLQSKREQGYLFHRNITDEEIVEGYHLNAKYV
ncbi:MAG: hypothetical protein HY072_04730 [Deltaproteobacteria bacterium]|nr:hypothetical protein [Deltaproteobacteria bacterium]